MNWNDILTPVRSEAYFQQLIASLRDIRKQQIVFPAAQDTFRAFELCSFQDLKIVILGQDPYHDHNQATGLAFSVPKHIPIPSSLRNIFTELKQDLQLYIEFDHGDLSEWAKQGILLYNTVLTVNAHQSFSHAHLGWQHFSRYVIRQLNQEKNKLVFMLWGNHARSFKHLIDSKKHLILEAAHPSGLSAYKGFFGCRHFSKANAYLCDAHHTSINWQACWEKEYNLEKS